VEQPFFYLLIYIIQFLIFMFLKSTSCNTNSKIYLLTSMLESFDQIFYTVVLFTLLYLPLNFGCLLFLIHVNLVLYKPITKKVEDFWAMTIIVIIIGNLRSFCNFVKKNQNGANHHDHAYCPI
jgi:hypothetical protein